MKRMIDIDDLMKRMNETGKGETICLNHDECEALLILLEEREERIDIMSEGGWHDVKTDPPKWDCDCIVCVNGESQFACARFDKEGMLSFYEPDIYESDVIPCVTHWMPLPEPPKEGASE